MPHAQPGVNARPARQTPVPEPLFEGPDAIYPAAPDEPVLDMANIQGNILSAFNKDFETLLFLRIRDGHAEAFRRSLGTLVPFVSNAAEVEAFNRLFKYVRTRRRVESRAVQATWINVAFSFAGLRKLTDGVDAFTDTSFKAGLAARSPDLGDPTDPHAEGNPANWRIGGPANEADVIVIVASDDEEDLAEEVRWVLATLHGVELLDREEGRTRPDLPGHEHFGFLDGVSQPGLRGRIAPNPTADLTPRQNPNEPTDQGKPGQDLLWPGEFVFGYPGQDPNGPDVSAPGPVSDAGPAWARDGSFLVFRRLRQDVGAFHAFLHSHAQQLGISPGFLGAKLVGRWASGGPISRAPRAADVGLAASLGGDDCANNNFEFQKDLPALPANPPSAFQCTDANPTPPPAQFSPSLADPNGQTCPFAGHIRKAYPRDDTSPTVPTLREQTTQTHRLLRRGIPFGSPSRSTPQDPVHDRGERGLLFLAYQTSITRQFEFVTRNWVNNPNFKGPNAGHDPIIGQNNQAGAHRQRDFQVTLVDDHGTAQTTTLTTTTDWVIPTGGGYFFAPSISVLDSLARGVALV